MTKEKRILKLYLLRQGANNGYDTYDSCVVAAYSHADAKTIHPNGESTVNDERPPYGDTWTVLKNVECKFLGVAGEKITRGVLCASFNAG